MESRNAEALDVLVAYCIDHPEQRFWQALRNISTFSAILGEKDGIMIETWNFEGLRGITYDCEFCHDGDWRQAYITHSIMTLETLPPQFECYYCRRKFKDG